MIVESVCRVCGGCVLQLIDCIFYKKNQLVIVFLLDFWWRYLQVSFDALSGICRVKNVC